MGRRIKLIRKWTPPVILLFIGAGQTILRALDYFGRTEALLTLIRALPEWAVALSNPLVGVVLLVLGLFLLYIMAGREKKAAAGVDAKPLVLITDAEVPAHGLVPRSTALKLAFGAVFCAFLLVFLGWFHYARHSARRDAQSALQESMRLKDQLKKMGSQQSVSAVITLTVLPADTPLKEEALLLSEDVLRFVVERVEYAPPYPSVGSWATVMKKVRDYNAETLRLFNTDFGVRLKRVHDALALRGLRDRALDELFQDPENIEGIKIVGQRISKLAQRLPQKAPKPH